MIQLQPVILLVIQSIHVKILVATQKTVIYLYITTVSFTSQLEAIYSGVVKS